MKDKTRFEELPWHDAELKEIFIDRTLKDTIRLKIRWPKNYANELAILEFSNCYAFKANMNFGFIPPDTILDAECLSETAEILQLQNTWKEMGVELSNILCFRWVTNTTNSLIEIYAKAFTVCECS